MSLDKLGVIDFIYGSSRHELTDHIYKINIEYSLHGGRGEHVNLTRITLLIILRRSFEMNREYL